MEAPLLVKVNDRIDRFTTTWKKAARFALLLSGHTVLEKDIVQVFREAATVQPKTEADVRLVNVQAGIPLVTQLRREGWTEEELARMEDDKQAEGSSGDRLPGAFEAGK